MSGILAWNLCRDIEWTPAFGIARCSWTLALDPLDGLRTALRVGL